MRMLSLRLESLPVPVQSRLQHQHIEAVLLACHAGRELFALAWVVEAASPAIARTLAGIEDLDSVAISVPDVPTVPTNALYGLFAQVRL